MSSQAVAGPKSLRLRRYLPLSLVVTLAVCVAPLAIVSMLGPAHSAPVVVAHVLAAVVMSMSAARLLALLWTRHERSNDLVFGDLLLWGWLRRALAERRLDTAARQLAAPDPGDDDRALLLRRMSALLEARDPYTHGHSRRVARHSERIAHDMGLPAEEIAKVRAAALVHDIGKINVPRAILNKPEQLTDAEFALVKRHPGDGAAMVAELGDPQLTAIVRHHHERLDGAGYPDGIAGHDIPVGARIIAVADTFDAITSTRAYRSPRTHKQALEVLQREGGSQLDPDAVAAFVAYYSSRRSIGWATAMAAASQRIVSGLGGVHSGVAVGVAPITQAACGVGAIALVSACIGGATAPAPTPAAAEADRPRVERQLAAAPDHATAHTPVRADRRVGEDTKPVAKRDERKSRPRVIQRPDRRALAVPDSSPAPGGGSGQTNSGSGGGVDLPEAPELPALPDLPPVPDAPTTVLEDSLKGLQLPQVQLPQQSAPLPGLKLP